MKRSEKALNYYTNGYNCAQAVVASFTDILNIEEEVALRMSSGFGGGMGRLQETCGAVTGAFMVISFMRGKYKVGDDKAKEITNNLIQDFSKKFAEKNGTINCKALIKYDLNTEEGQQEAIKEGVFDKKCSKLVTFSVELLEEILEK